MWLLESIIITLTFYTMFHESSDFFKHPLTPIKPRANSLNCFVSSKVTTYYIISYNIQTYSPFTSTHSVWTIFSLNYFACYLIISLRISLSMIVFLINLHYSLFSYWSDCFLSFSSFHINFSSSLCKGEGYETITPPSNTQW